ncbi:MAG TPA: molybdopterin-dependent oxidoreductase [Xanthobacteraceae bacterium]|jgi:DMSO/TMAO reductase YedYZ molybdopterin-dependent catalytic subunit|nr:molybdopterin-dependent oxidoreductase [Xanthobacteraceae bacterium]
MLTRRGLITSGAGLALAGSGLRLAPSDAAAGPLDLPAALPEGARGNAVLDTLPGKKPLIKLSYRPPNYETPLEYFRTAITPNDAFFVRYHLSNIPEVDVRTWKIAVGGEGANGEAEFTLDDLKQLPAAELAAVNLCSGNRRGLFQPHVPGVEWGYGAMGCARWKGARLKDLLDKVGLKKEAIEILFDGADSGVSDKTPDFVKSIPTWKAVEDTTLVAYEMNGAPLPHLNGFPARLIVPGWTGTYWMKHLTTIKALTKPEASFWMNPAYRIPLGRFPLVARFTSQETAVNTPITEIVVNSLITDPLDGANVRMGPIAIGGIAWDGGYGISSVEVSSDGGKTWMAATLGEDLGRFAFRTFTYDLLAKATGKQTVMARATNKIGQTQTSELIHNPAGYHHNVVHSVTFNVA